MLAGIKEMASYKDEVNTAYHLEAFEYLDACNKLFERGILSHDLIDSQSFSVLHNMMEGMKHFVRFVFILVNCAFY